MTYIEKEVFNENVNIKQTDISKLKNFFNIYQQDGTLLREGHNILLDVGRKVNAFKILGQNNLVLSGTENTSGTTISVSDCRLVKFKGFSLYGGDVPSTPGNLPLPPEPIHTDIPTITAADSLDFGNLLVPKDNKSGNYDTSGKIKIHVSPTNPESIPDMNGVMYSKNLLAITKQEVKDKYFNVCVTWVAIYNTMADVAADTPKAYAPYSKFVFAPIHNQNGLLSTDIYYGLYL